MMAPHFVSQGHDDRAEVAEALIDALGFPEAVSCGARLGEPLRASQINQVQGTCIMGILWATI